MKPLTFDESDLRRFLRLETRTTRLLRSIRRLLKLLFFFGLVFFLLFYLINGAAFWERLKFLARDEPAAGPAAVLQPSQPKIVYEPRLLIPKIGVDAPAIYNAPYEEILANLRYGVVQYEGTALPGQVGNLVILGHSSNYPWAEGSYKTVFALLDKLTVGDEIVVPFESQRSVYKVIELRVVKPTELDVLDKTGSPQLTLMTCYPVGTTRSRLVVRAELVEGKITGEQASMPFLGEKLPTPR